MVATCNPALLSGLVSWHKGNKNTTIDASRLVSQWDSIVGTYPATAATTARPTLTRSDNLETRNIYSGTLSNGTWAKVRSSYLGGVLIEDGTAGNSHFTQTAAQPIVIGRRYRYRARVKLKERHISIRLDASAGFDAGYAHFNLTTGAVTSTTGAVGNATITADADYWIISAEETATASGNAYPGLYLTSTPGTTAYNGDTASGAYVDWGQFQESTADQTYVATTDHPEYAGIMGKSTLVLDGSSDYLRIDALSSIFNGTDLPYTIFSVYKLNSLAGSGFLYWAYNATDTSTKNFHRFTAIEGATVGNAAVKDNASAVGAVATLAAPTTSLLMCSEVCTGTTATFYKNGVLNSALNAAYNVGNVVTSKMIIGAYYNGSYSNFLNANLCEFIVYNRALSTDERQLVEAYLADDWQNSTHTNFVINYPSDVLSGTVAWNCGREPTYTIMRGLSERTPNARARVMNVQLTWDGVSDVQRDIFIKAVASYMDLTPFVLTETEDYVFDGWGSFTARLVDYEVVPKHGSNIIRANFEEII